MGFSANNVRGLILALSSSAFIGTSFIIKKKGLMKAGASGVGASAGGHSYLKEPMWWAGMITMVAGEIANFVAYAYAPAVLVTPLGALSIIVSEILAHFVLKERLHIFGVVGIVLCVIGSVGVVIHAPQERTINSVKLLWHLALQPGFIIYFFVVLVSIVILVFWVAPQYGTTNILVYIAVCSLAGSLTVMGVKAVGIALKLSFGGKNQFKFYQTWIFVLLVIGCVLVQMNYLNKALDTFNINIVSPVYYVAFTCLTIVASMIMLKDWDHATSSQIIGAITGFITILCGTFLLHRIKDTEKTPVQGTPCRSPEVNTGSARGSRTTEVNASDSGSFRTPDVNSDIAISVSAPEIHTDNTEGGSRTSEGNTVNARVSNSTEADV
ncbi:putative magnesium transporter [Heracleum sosnowskyi]|uniref:Probable magnesium transporter n=1 Tax=Heracleum sosnowskyi TaxID=360622 RepID=A0AAD8IAX4_9APIA|nr:putative magnesium transporter [Heracleum sosnowskyi]